MGMIGIEWVNKYHGRAADLTQRGNNARGFYNTLLGVRWFEFGDDLAWDQDFKQIGMGQNTTGQDYVWADKVDIAYFSGHGGWGGVLFGVDRFDDGSAVHYQMRLGDKNCKWVIFDACHVLEYDDGAVFDRYCNVFGGLHYILGFDTIAHDNGDRGRIFADRLNWGWSIRESWIMACMETEGSDVRCAYLRADAPGTNTSEDHWPDNLFAGLFFGNWGFVSPNPRNPTRFSYLSTSC